MKINRIELKNFKKYESFALDLHPHFTLLVGENGSGKTTILDALAVAASVWLMDVPDTNLVSSRRPIRKSEIHVFPQKIGDRVQFVEKMPVEITSQGLIDNHSVSWVRSINSQGDRKRRVREALEIIHSIYEREQRRERVLCPILAYYGAGRAWLPPKNKKPTRTNKNSVRAKRWAAFYDCFSQRIRFDELLNWFRAEAIEKGNNSGEWRPGFNIVRYAICNCLPGADHVRFDGDRDQIIVSINRQEQPLDNLSAGQRMLVAMIADLAIKVVTQNAFLVPSTNEKNQNEEGLPRVLAETPGLVLIDELDVHLHPTWQRMIATCLKNTFPEVQFVCTSHSPQVIGEVQPDELRFLSDNNYEIPNQSYGMDSNWVVEKMGGDKCDPKIKADLNAIFKLIDDKKILDAESEVLRLRGEIGNTNDLQRAMSLIERMRLLGK
jgi:predicted ATP-binding protein involved in virulence